MKQKSVIQFKIDNFSCKSCDRVVVECVVWVLGSKISLPPIGPVSEDNVYMIS